MHGSQPEQSVDDLSLAPSPNGGLPGEAVAQELLPEIAVFGEWNTMNLGDRAIHQGVLEFFSACGWRVTSYGLGSLTPASAASAHDSATTRAGRISRLLNQAPPLKRSLREVRQRVRMRALSPALERAHAIMVGGGALLTDFGLHFPQSLAVVAETAQRLGKPLLCLGCGTDGDDAWSDQGVRKIRKFLSACTVVAARDQVTAERCGFVLGRRVPVFGDFALGGWAENRRGEEPHRRALSINVQQLNTRYMAKQGKYEDALVALTRGVMHGAAGRSVDTVRIFTTGTPDDTGPARRVFGRLASDRVELDIPHSLEGLSRLLGDSALVISTRLHAAALALAEGAPVVSVTPMTKAHNFFATLGLADFSFDLESTDLLIDRINGGGCAVIGAKQRDSMARSAIWATRAQIQNQVRSLAAKQSECT
jgi:polysaccharide pyruvyl transferase WcaK-like protein